MCNREDEQMLLVWICLDAVDDVVGEAPDQIPARAAKHHRSSLRKELEALERLLDEVQEDVTKAFRLCIVEGRRLEEFPPRQGMPGNPNHLRRERASSNTFSEGIACTAPAFNSW